MSPSAALAYLYRQLGTATRADVRQIVGYLTLLTSWVYEHFPFARPPAQWGYTVGMLLASRWNLGQDSGNVRKYTATAGEVGARSFERRTIFVPHLRQRRSQLIFIIGHYRLPSRFWTACR